MPSFLKPTIIQAALYRQKDGTVLLAPIVHAWPRKLTRGPNKGKVVSFEFKCPFCGRLHSHGGEGTRVTACDRKNVRIEYYVRPIGAEGPLRGWGE